MRFADNNFNIYRSNTKTDLVNELYKDSFAKVRATDVDDWCKQCAARILEQYDYKIQYDSLETFADELIFYKLIMEIN
jgi:hypothetical protein